jgi:hypothetical protein
MEKGGGFGQKRAFDRRGYHLFSLFSSSLYLESVSSSFDFVFDPDQTLTKTKRKKQQ